MLILLPCKWMKDNSSKSHQQQKHKAEKKAQQVGVYYLQYRMHKRIQNLYFQLIQATQLNNILGVTKVMYKWFSYYTCVLFTVSH